jgi:hypothetical protein
MLLLQTISVIREYLCNDALELLTEHASTTIIAQF